MEGNDFDIDVEHHPCRHLARAWWDGDLLAESTTTVRIERPGLAPQLGFPVSSVHRDRFVEGPIGLGPIGGEGRWWSVAGVEIGEKPLATFYESAGDWPAGMVVFDHDRIRVELVDGPDGEPGTSLKRFPTWGDAAHLVDILDVRPSGEGLFESVTRASHIRSVVEGSQMLGQSIVAAGRYVPGRRAVSAHLAVLRVADATTPLCFQLTELTSGRTFTALRVDVTQSGRLCASGSLLLDVVAPDVVRHQEPAPPVSGPYQSPSYDMSVIGRDVRMVDDAYDNSPEAPVGPPTIDTWVRFRDLPADPYIHAGILAQFTGHVSIAAALRPHQGVSQSQAHRSLSTAINAISISLHSDVRADQWMLYHHHSTFAGDGMTHSECRVYGEQGNLLASFTVDAMVRGLSDAESHGGATRAL